MRPHTQVHSLHGAITSLVRDYVKGKRSIVLLKGSRIFSQPCQAQLLVLGNLLDMLERLEREIVAQCLGCPGSMAAVVALMTGVYRHCTDITTSWASRKQWPPPTQGRTARCGRSGCGARAAASGAAPRRSASRCVSGIAQAVNIPCTGKDSRGAEGVAAVARAAASGAAPWRSASGCAPTRT